MSLYIVAEVAHKADKAFLGTLGSDCPEWRGCSHQYHEDLVTDVEFVVELLTKKEVVGDASIEHQLHWNAKVGFDREGWLFDYSAGFFNKQRPAVKDPYARLPALARSRYKLFVNIVEALYTAEVEFPKPPDHMGNRCFVRFNTLNGRAL